MVDDVVTGLTAFSRLRQGIEALAAQAKRSSTIMWMLGPFMFSRDTAAPQKLQRIAEFRWAEHQRYGKEPTLQFTGPGADTIKMDGIIYPHYKGGFSQMALMREMGKLGLPMILVEGRGIVYGKWVIQRVEETGSNMTEIGTPRKIDFIIDLRHYPDDKTFLPGGII